MEKQHFGWNISTSLRFICNYDSKISRLVNFLNKQIWSPTDRQEILEDISKLFMNGHPHIGKCFQPILLDIITRCERKINHDGQAFTDIQDFCIALSHCLHLSDIQRFALNFLVGKPSFIKKEEHIDSEPRRKKAKQCQTRDQDICHAAWLFICHLGDAVRPVIPLDDLVSYLSHDSEDVQWYACQAIVAYQKLTSEEGNRLLLQCLKDEHKCRQMKIRHATSMNVEQSDDVVCHPEVTSHVTSTGHMILESDLCGEVTCVSGVVLPKLIDVPDLQLDLLPVPSNESNLHRLAIAVSSGRPILLQGVIGSGKTALIEHLGKLTGRLGPPSLMKIQLGDQMDSKALLGTYHCTDLPGEFVWQPGVLTQAVMRGYWVLLEDIDFAPMEVISVLLPLLESRTLSVPGHGDCLRASPGFHLFATQRLVSSSSGWQKQQSSASTVLDKLWTTILVTPLSRQELSEVLITKYPQMETVMERLLDIYFLLSSGDHQQTAEVTTETDLEAATKFLSHNGRLISTRDLMTWCKRIAKDFDVSSTAMGNIVFHEALDCFASCLSKPAKYLQVAEAIGSKLNIAKVKAEYFCEKYKPDIKMSGKALTVGRVSLPIKESASFLFKRMKTTFSYTRQSSVLLEKVAVCVWNREPVLLVGETGTGKTSTVQFLAEQLGHRLHVINMNQQSDSADLLGGFKPVDLRHIIKPFHEDFELLFCKSFSRKQNVKFLGHLQESYVKKKWDTLFSLMEHTTKSALEKFKQDNMMVNKWHSVYKKLLQLKLQVQQTQSTLAFTFLEGSLVKALRSGDWVLLDEINLAAMETLECLSGLLESNAGSVLLMERGDIEPVVRHADFCLFACMNPATDVGKKDLSPGIRNRFTELFVDELEDSQDLKTLVCDYLRGLSLTAGQVDGIVKFYLTAKNEAVKKLTDGTGHPPHYSLRTLCRALRFAERNSCGSVTRSLYEGFCMSFLTQLDRASHPVVQQMICQHIIGNSNVKSILKKSLPAPTNGRSLNFEGYWIHVGDKEPVVPDDYILTPSVRANLKDLARVVSAGQHPVLIQGETSVGKTSLIRWLALSSGNVCVRVNNHEHTDLQEYVGCYAADVDGKLAFKEGVLVEAMRKGHWIILDELNLAPTDVLEALNRLLDDNRELYIPETQETVKAHPKFMLFATQNPPGQYGGRKMLSRAFRNRFVELHFDEIPSQELETILHERCSIPLSYAKRLVLVMLELQLRRRGSGVFAGKMGFMTLRDLFRWADRYKCLEMEKEKFYDWDKHLADQGYMLLAGRVRKVEEADLIQEIIQKHFKCKVSANNLFTITPSTSLTSKAMLENILNQSLDGFKNIVWTFNMRRLAVLIAQAVQYKEPVLLVGETGCGKTTMCQLFATIYNTQLHSVNCHLHTESADFLGGIRPVRDHSQADKKDKLFEWVDGPLVQAMKDGTMFLIDEISLADDSVLERLNSVLEPERTLLLAEKGGEEGNLNDLEQIIAKEGFHVFATMNPGGDFGKKELSPALRNRFTEIWCPPTDQKKDLINIIEHNLKAGIQLCNQEDDTSGIGYAIMDFVHWFTNNELGKRCTVSIRDILTWVHFINTCSRTQDSDNEGMDSSEIICNQLDPAMAYIHGACLVFLDGLGAGVTSQGGGDIVTQLRKDCMEYLLNQVNNLTCHNYDIADLHLVGNCQLTSKTVMTTDNEFCIIPFSIRKGDRKSFHKVPYALDAPGTCNNAQRVLRALQLPRSLLLEGSPGVGKTSLVAAIAQASDQELVRINLSEQTDVTDLFGADLPVEGTEGGGFAWRDGPLLQALKAGSWIVLDECNLASQSVLEGLNACLDHRAEIYIPELGKTFHIQHEKTRLFACQNPLNQGGGRKGLPRSFLNRFTQVYVEPLSHCDLMFIASIMYPDIPQDIMTNMVNFNMQMHEETVVNRSWGQRGSPWEFNLRDLFRWCDLIQANQRHGHFNPGEYVGLVYVSRMRSESDRQQVYELYQKIFPGEMEVYKTTGVSACSTELVQVGHSFLKVNPKGHVRIENEIAMEMLHHYMESLESVMKCVQMNWMTILVGPTASGKTSIVNLLATLTGNHLNVLTMNSSMDTTELLGGFEQVDDHRHIDEIAGEVDDIVQFICSQCLLLNEESGSLAMVARLQESWRGYTANNAEKTSSVEELTLMKNQVKLLKFILIQCKKIVQEKDMGRDKVKTIMALKKKLVKLQNKLSVVVPGKRGGAFEWVNSLLVKSLIDGHWLMIENVNFCSASVLDRLNALLEPNGVLAINERGVIDGEIPTIKPHPDFRLFLSMDPKHGEISRAMRNRGVEIYMPGEEDGKSFSDFDLQLIYSGLGLKTTPLFNWLINLHKLLREELPRGDKPSILDLLQVFTGITEYRNHGYDIEQAITNVCNDVYVQRQRHRQSKQLSLNIYEEHLKNLPSVMGQKLEIVPVLGITPVKLPNLMQFREDPTYAQVVKNAAMFVYLLEARIARTETSELTDIKLKHALNNLLSLTSLNGLLLAVDWLQNYCRKEIDYVDICRHIVDSLLHMCRNFTGSVNTERWKNCKEKLDSVTSEWPADLRWNTQMLDNCLVTCAQQDMSTFMMDSTVFFNRFHVLQYFQLEVSVVKKNVAQLESAIQKDKQQRKSTLHEAVSHLVALFPVVTAAVTNEIQCLELNTYQKAMQVLETVEWLRHLYRVATDNLYTSNAGPYLSLFWKWFCKKYDHMFAAQQSADQKLVAICSVLHRILHKDDRKWKIFTKYWSSWGHPGPFQHETDALQYLEASKLFRMLKFSHSSSNAWYAINKVKVEILMSNRQQLVDIADCLLNKLDGCPDEEGKTGKMLAILHGFLRSHGLFSHPKSDVAMETESNDIAAIPIECNKQTLDQPVEFVQLWPLFVCQSVIASWDLLTSLSSHQEVEKGRLESFIDYVTNFSPMLPSEVAIYRNIQEQPQKNWLSLVYSQVFVDLRKSVAVYYPDKWLAWPEILSDDYDQKSVSKISFHQSPLAYTLSVLLSRADKSVSLTVPPNVNISASLKSYTREIKQLSYIASHLWCHVHWYGSSLGNPYNLDNCCLRQSFLHSLRSLVPLLSSEFHTDFMAILDRLSTYATIEDMDQLKLLIQHVLIREYPNLMSGILAALSAVITDSSSDVGLLGSAWVELGLFNMQLLAPKEHVDPVEKFIIKLNILKEQLVDCDAELEVLCMHHRLATGQQLTDVSHRLVHPRVPFLVSRTRELDAQIKEITKQVAYRPHPSQYNQLVKDIQNYMDVIGSVENVHRLTTKLMKLSHKPSAAQSALQEVELWEISQDKFVEMIETEYPLYRDITTPFVCAVHQMVLGVHTLQHVVRQQGTIQRLLNCATSDLQIAKSTLETLIMSVGQFPSLSSQHPSCLHLAMYLTSDAALSLVNKLTSACMAEDESSHSISDSILTGCLYHVVNSAKVRGALSSDLVTSLTQILEIYVSSWQQAEDDKKAQEEEEASLYRFKSQTHGNVMSEDEIQEAEFQIAYPQFQHEFADLLESSLEDTFVRPANDTDQSQSSQMLVTSSQMTLIFNTHQQIYKHLVSTDWYRSVGVQELQLCDWTMPYLSLYTAASFLSRSLCTAFGSRIGSQMLGGHLLVSVVQKYSIEQASQQGPSMLIPTLSLSDFYHHSNVPEATQCLPVLQGLRKRVAELQLEWPGHPTLKQLNEICSRIESFAISSPVVKFLTGLELVLQKAQDWERNASQHVSMATHLSDISRIIVQWRKLELSCWSNALNTAVSKYKSNASKWWFHIYQVIKGALQPKVTEGPAGLDDVIKTLKHFIEQSTLGDFHVRLDMLLGYHCHLVTIETSDTQTQLMNVLWNMYHFYGQFAKTVQTELDRLREPVEKQLKGFVKIARWSDINYWALKKSVEKTHRTLHKQIKLFQAILEQPVKGILGDVDGTTAAGVDHAVWVEKLQKYHEDFMASLPQKQAIGILPLPDIMQQEQLFPLQHKLSHLSVKLMKHWKQIVAHTSYCSCIVVLDHFTGDLIENIHELQSLEVNRNLEKAKQKSEAKCINLRKRTRLSELFKYLVKIGLSYRKGLTISDNGCDNALLVQPLDLSVTLDSDSIIQDVWQGCMEYYYKCVGRRAQFGVALISPSKELGIGNIERCRGFVEHMFKLLLQQHSMVVSLATHYKQLNSLLRDLDGINSDSRIHFSQEEVAKWKNTCQDLIIQLVEGLNQFLVILYCCPAQHGGDMMQHPSPLPSTSLHQMALAKQGDEILENAISTVKGMICNIKEAQKTLLGQDRNLLCWSDVLLLEAVFEKVSSIRPIMQQQIKLFSEPDCNHSDAFTGVLHFLCDEITQKYTEFHKWIQLCSDNIKVKCSVDTETVSHFSEKVESIVSSVLLVVQKFSKRHVTNKSESSQKEAPDDSDLMDGHLVKNIVEKLLIDQQDIDLINILSYLRSLVQDVTSCPNQDTAEILIRILYRCTPLLSQYKDIVHHQLICNLAAQRTMGKLLSVLLGVFTELASKGFCIPPEFSDEMLGEGATEFHDAEDAGMGEGEGVKNVSDQIEDEDQLDEAKRPEDHKKDEESLKPDVKSEENAIEMSEDIDAKVQDLEDVDKEEDDEEKNEEDEDDVDKHMGDIDEQAEDKLDEQMWGSDEEEEKEDLKEESGPGDGKQSEPELVAKDDSESKEECDKDQEKEGEQNEDEEKKPHNLDDQDQNDVDDNQIDPYHGQQEDKQAPEELDLPDDLHLDDDMDDEEKESENGPVEELGEQANEEETNLPEEDHTDTADDKAADEKDEDEKDENEKDDESPEDKKEDEKDIDMDTNETDRQEEEGNDSPGFMPEDEAVENSKQENDQNEADDIPQSDKHYGKVSQDTTDTVEQCDTAEDTAGETSENNQQEVDGTGQSSSYQVEGHLGQMSATPDTSSEGKRKKQEQKPGQSDKDRSLGSTEQQYKRLKTTDATEYKQSDQQQKDKEADPKSGADNYEHIKDSKSHYDAQTLDVATVDQQEEQGQINPEMEMTDDSDVGSDTEMMQDQDDKLEEQSSAEFIQAAKLKEKSKVDVNKLKDDDSNIDVDIDTKYDLPGERVATETVARGPESTIHTALDQLHLRSSMCDLEKLRSELENQLGSWSQLNIPVDKDRETTAYDLWHRYEALTSNLAQDLCEQLRLVLEPSQATKLKGDYRTGKRLNMRKVIPYIASQFRKDKIWLRRTRPSKRQYQIMLAVDDSSSMEDNHSKQMAFESLALIANALTLLEAGQLSICSFGETVNVLHPFTEQFMSQSGAHLLQFLTFEQKKTRIAQLLQYVTALMLDARQQQHGLVGNPETSQLLLIMSDGRGLFMEGMEVVKSAVRKAREANVFIVFVIIDNPMNKDSILDIKVPIFKQAGQIPDIKSYMDSFPFPFYIILRDINSLPIVLSDALRQWFELVTALDR